MNDPQQTLSLDEMFRPPINRVMRSLDRSFFQRKCKLAAACILDNKQIQQTQKDLTHEILKLDRLQTTRPVPVEISEDGKLKCLLLRPDIQVDDSTSWSSKLKELVNANQVLLTSYDLELNYDYWTYHDIMSAILPEEDQDEIPTGFSIVGHVAHLNLRENFLPYKSIIASVLMDKNPSIRTVINKIDEVGEENEYRTFKYEVLAGPDDLRVEAREQDCIFSFDYAKVYWNTRLNTEHTRLVQIFQPGEAVCDVMAGVGPFAVPAAKRKVFVWANDLNPKCYESLKDNINRNKVNQFVRPFCDNGHSFIRTSTSHLLRSTHSVKLTPKTSRTSRAISNKTPSKPIRAETIIQPKTFAHYVLNLPATALTFLPSFIGLYAGHKHLFHPHTDTKLPIIHAYCFSTKSDDNTEEEVKICQEVSRQLGYVIAKVGDEEMEIRDVRDVAPKKRMFCASFRLPAEVAFRQVDGTGKE